MQFLGNFGKIVYLRPSGGLAPPSRGIPGSATENVFEKNAFELYNSQWVKFYTAYIILQIGKDVKFFCCWTMQ